MLYGLHGNEEWSLSAIRWQEPFRVLMKRLWKVAAWTSTSEPCTSISSPGCWGPFPTMLQPHTPAQATAPHLQYPT